MLVELEIPTIGPHTFEVEGDAKLRASRDHNFECWFWKASQVFGQLKVITISKRALSQTSSSLLKISH